MNTPEGKRSGDTPREFYDALANSYHLLFTDWERSIVAQAEVISAILGKCGVAPDAAILDCACGIGTQSLGLAMRGYAVTGSDISPQEVDRARLEARRLGLNIPFVLADFRFLAQSHPGTFDCVIAMDNALPHLTERDDLARCLSGIHDRLNPSGLFVASIRDYDAILANKPVSPPAAVIDAANGRRVALQVWDWHGDVYDFTQYIIVDEGDTPKIEAFRSRYRAVTRAELSASLCAAGFMDVGWLFPEESGYYQPIVTAKKNV